MPVRDGSSGPAPKGPAGTRVTMRAVAGSVSGDAEFAARHRPHLGANREFRNRLPLAPLRPRAQREIHPALAARQHQFGIGGRDANRAGVAHANAHRSRGRPARAWSSTRTRRPSGCSPLPDRLVGELRHHASRARCRRESAVTRARAWPAAASHTVERRHVPARPASGRAARSTASRPPITWA